MAAQLKLTNKKRINPVENYGERKNRVCVHMKREKNKTIHTMKKRPAFMPDAMLCPLCVCWAGGRDNQLISGCWRLMAHLRANGNRLLRSTSKRRAVNFSPFFPRPLCENVAEYTARA